LIALAGEGSIWRTRDVGGVASMDTTGHRKMILPCWHKSLITKRLRWREPPSFNLLVRFAGQAVSRCGIDGPYFSGMLAWLSQIRNVSL